MINHRSSSISSNSYDSSSSNYRPSRFYSYPNNGPPSSNGYDQRYRNYQRKPSNEYVKPKRDPHDEEDLVYGSIKPSKSRPDLASSSELDFSKLVRGRSDSPLTDVTALRQDSVRESNSPADKDKAEFHEDRKESKVIHPDEPELKKEEIKLIPPLSVIDEKLTQDLKELEEQKIGPVHDQEVEPTQGPKEELKDSKDRDESKEHKEVVQGEKVGQVEQVEEIEESSEKETKTDTIQASILTDNDEVIPKQEAEDRDTRESSVSSDLYDPLDLPISAVEDKKDLVTKPSLISSIRYDDEEMDEPELEPMDIDQVQENYLPEVEGCIFPMNRLETKLWDLKKHSKSAVRSKLPYLMVKPLDDFTKYPFFETNVLIHHQAMKPKLLDDFTKIKQQVDQKAKSLFLQFYEQNLHWKEHVKIMEEQLKQLHHIEDEDNDQAVGSPLEQKHEEFPTSSRRGRNTGIVNSELEFAEILQRMKEEEENDPIYRAKQALATIPDMILDPITKHALKFISTNNLVTDLQAWESRLISDKIDNFTQLEHELFCELYASYPKRFGKISSAMDGRRTAEECVLHYYRTKSKTNYKLLVLAKNKRVGRKSSKGRGKLPNKSRTGTNTHNTPTPTETRKEYFPEDGVPSEAKEEEEKENDRKRDVDAMVDQSNIEAVDEKLSVEAEHATKKPRLSKKKSKESDIAEEEEKSDELLASTQLEVLQSVASLAQVEGDPDLQVKGEPYVESSLASSVFLKTSKKEKKAPHITSYWSINDANKFPGILAELGTQWLLIAKRIQTKTTTMVRNYYSKNANESNGWVRIAREADLKRHLENGSVAPEDTPQLSGPPSSQGSSTSIPSTSVPSSLPQSQDIFTQQQPVRLPSLKDVTSGMTLAYSNEQQNPFPLQPPQFATFQPQMPSRDDEDRKYANVFNPMTSAPPVPHPQPAPVPPVQPSRTSIMSLLNSDTDERPVEAPPKPNGLSNLLNSTPYVIPPPQPPKTSGLFSLEALAEVATEDLNHSKFQESK